MGEKSRVADDVLRPPQTEEAQNEGGLGSPGIARQSSSGKCAPQGRPRGAVGGNESVEAMTHAWGHGASAGRRSKAQHHRCANFKSTGNLVGLPKLLGVCCCIAL